MDFLFRLSKALDRARRLSCPRCGERTLFRGAFTMAERCATCGLVFEREPGYFVAAIYINYAVTAILIIGGYLALDTWLHPSVTLQLVIWGAAAVAFPLLFFRYSKSLWLAVDHCLDADEPDLRPLRHRRS